MSMHADRRAGRIAGGAKLLTTYVLSRPDGSPIGVVDVNGRDVEYARLVGAKRARLSRAQVTATPFDECDFAVQYHALSVECDRLYALRRGAFEASERRRRAGLGLGGIALDVVSSHVAGATSRP